MLDHLCDYPAKVVIRYEDLFENGILTDPFRNALKRIADLDLAQGLCQSLRTAPPNAEMH